MTHHEDEDTTARRRLPLALLALLGLSLVVGPLVTDKAPGAWGVTFTVAGAVLVLAALGLAGVDAMQARGITPDDDTNGDTDR